MEWKSVYLFTQLKMEAFLCMIYYMAQLYI
jgi:hypothetical protein